MASWLADPARAIASTAHPAHAIAAGGPSGVRRRGLRGGFGWRGAMDVATFEVVLSSGVARFASPAVRTIRTAAPAIPRAPNSPAIEYATPPPTMPATSGRSLADRPHAERAARV